MDTIIKLFDDVKSMIWPIGVADVIDMLIMAFVIYKVILLIRRTSSGGVAKGILLLVAALWVSSFLRLYTVNFLLSKVVEWGVLALVILFQPEIRRFLEQVGRSRRQWMLCWPLSCGSWRTCPTVPRAARPFP